MKQNNPYDNTPIDTNPYDNTSPDTNTYDTVYTNPVYSNTHTETNTETNTDTNTDTNTETNANTSLRNRIRRVIPELIEITLYNNGRRVTTQNINDETELHTSKSKQLFKSLRK